MWQRIGTAPFDIEIELAVIDQRWSARARISLPSSPARLDQGGNRRKHCRPPYALATVEPNSGWGIGDHEQPWQSRQRVDSMEIHTSTNRAQNE